MARPRAVFQTVRLARPSNRPALQRSKISHRQGQEGDAQQEKGRICGLCVVKRLDVIVNGDGNRTRDPWYVSADHKDDAKLPESMRKSENETGQDPGPRNRADYAEEGTKRR